MNVPDHITKRRAQILAERAIGKNVPQVDIDRLKNADKSVGNEDILRGLPLFLNGRMAKGCTMTGTRPGDRALYANEVATDLQIDRING